MIVTLSAEIPHLRRNDDAVRVTITGGRVELTATVGTRQAADALAMVAERLATGDYTIEALGSRTGYGLRREVEQ